MAQDFTRSNYWLVTELSYTLPEDKPVCPYRDCYYGPPYSDQLIPSSAWHPDDFLLSAEEQSIARIYRNIMYPEYNQGNTK